MFGAGLATHNAHLAGPVAHTRERSLVSLFDPHGLDNTYGIDFGANFVAFSTKVDIITTLNINPDGAT